MAWPFFHMYACLGPNRLFLYGNQSHWMRTHPKDLILTCHFFKDSVTKHSEVLWLRTQHFQFSSVPRLHLTLWDPMNRSMPGLSITSSRSPPKLMSIELVMPSSLLILCRPLLLLPSIFPSIRVFSKESVLCIRWPKYWNFSFNISPSSEHPGLISFRMDWLDLLAVQGTLKSLLQYHSSKASILNPSAFFIV